MTSKKTILVTGHKGFVGKHVMHTFKDKYNLMGVDLKEDQDIRLKETFDKLHKADLVIHLAANCSSPKSVIKPTWDAETNIIGTINVLEYCKKYDIPIIFTSTCRIYTDDLEESAFGDRPPYGLSKYVAEMYIDLYHRLYGINYIIVRPSTIFGEWQEGSQEAGWVHHFVKKSIEKEKITIFGDGEQTRDVLYVGDLIELFEELINCSFENKKEVINNIYNVGGGQSNSISLNNVCEYLGAKTVNGNPRKPDFRHYVSDMEKLFSITDWRPKTNWKKGIKKIQEELKNGKER